MKRKSVFILKGNMYTAKIRKNFRFVKMDM